MAGSKGKSEKKGGLVYVIAGKEETLVNAQCQALVEGLLEPEQRVTGFFDADPAEVCISEILDELRTAPFLTDKRVVLVRRADKFVSENRELLEKYFDKPCPTGVLVLTVSTWDSRTRLSKKLPKVGRLISVTQPKAWELPRRLIQYTSDAHAKNLVNEAAELLVELTGDDLTRLYSEIDKLAVFAHEEKSITAEHVEVLTGHNRMFNAFAVIDAVTEGDVSGAIDRLRRMFAVDKSAEYTAVGAFAFHFRRMFNAKVMLEDGVRPSGIASQLRVWSNKDGFFRQVRGMSLKKIGDILQELGETDYAIKTGQATAHVAIEQLVVRLAGIGASKRSARST